MYSRITCISIFAAFILYARDWNESWLRWLWQRVSISPGFGGPPKNWTFSCLVSLLRQELLSCWTPSITSQTRWHTVLSVKNPDQLKYFLNCILPLLVHEVGNKEDDFICEICARPFPTKAYLRTHMRTHNEKKIKVVQNIIQATTCLTVVKMVAAWTYRTN